MECPLGSETRNNRHEVKTEAKAEEWLRFPPDPGWLPLLVNQDIAANGRARITIYDRHGKRILQRG